MRPTGTGWATAAGAVLLLATGLALRYPPLVALGVAGIAALLFAAGYLTVRPGLDVRRSVTPDRVTVGGSANGRLIVTNTGRIAAHRFEAVESVDGVPLPIPVPPLSPGETRALHYPVLAGYRGLLRLGPVVLRRVDPLGLLRRGIPLAGRELLWVRPRVHRVPPLPVGLALEFDGRLTDTAPRGSTAFAGLRGYVPGDDPRAIHWRSTARLGTVVVREHVDTTEPRAAVVLDTRADVLTGEQFEAAVEVAASIAVACGRAGQEVALAALGEDRARVAALGAVDLLDRLAALKQTPAGTGTDAAALARLADRLPAGGCLLVVSGAAGGLLPTLARQRRRYSRVLIVQCGLAADGPDPAATLRRPGLTAIRAADALTAAQALRAHLGTRR